MACDNYRVNDYAIKTYGSELAGDCLNCVNCGRPWHEHPNSLFKDRDEDEYGRISRDFE